METESTNETPKEIKHLYALIGSIASTWSHIEQSVDVTLWSLAGLDAHVGACLTAQISSLTYRLDALAALVELRGGSQELKKSIKEFHEKTYALSIARNRAVHDPIAIVDNGAVAITITARKSLAFDISATKKAEYTKTNSEITGLLRRYSELAKKIETEISRPAPRPI
jgi:hypothetical protein